MIPEANFRRPAVAVHVPRQDRLRVGGVMHLERTMPVGVHAGGIIKIVGATVAGWHEAGNTWRVVIGPELQAPGQADPVRHGAIVGVHGQVGHIALHDKPVDRAVIRRHPQVRRGQARPGIEGRFGVLGAPGDGQFHPVADTGNGRPRSGEQRRRVGTTDAVTRAIDDRAGRIAARGRRLVEQLKGRGCDRRRIVHAREIHRIARRRRCRAVAHRHGKRLGRVGHEGIDRRRVRRKGVRARRRRDRQSAVSADLRRHPVIHRDVGDPIGQRRIRIDVGGAERPGAGRKRIAGHSVRVTGRDSGAGPRIPHDHDAGAARTARTDTIATTTTTTTGVGSS